MNQAISTIEASKCLRDKLRGRYLRTPDEWAAALDDGSLVYEASELMFDICTRDTRKTVDAWIREIADKGLLDMTKR